VHVSRTIEIAAGAASVVMFVATIIAVPVFFARIPDDYFVRHERHSLGKRVVKNAAGVALVALGIAMLLLPGQGILTLLVGLALLDLPGKKRVVRWLLDKERVKRAIDALRAKHGRGPLVPPPAPA
jgi:hypothetical protein